MTRVKRGVISLKRRRKVLRQTKGFRHGLKSKERQAKEAIFHAGVHAFHDRRKKKREMRKLWQIKINAASRSHGLPYSKFVNKLKNFHREIKLIHILKYSNSYINIFKIIMKNKRL